MDLKIHDGTNFILPNNMTNNDESQAYITTSLTKKGSIDEDPLIGITQEPGTRNILTDLTAQLLHYEITSSLKKDYPDLNAKLINIEKSNDTIKMKVSINGATILV